VHAPVDERTCPYCSKIYLDKSSVSRHVARCGQRPSAEVSCVLPRSSVPCSTAVPGTKAKVLKRNYPPVERYLPLLSSYLSAGEYVHTFPTCQEELKATTIRSYISFVRKYLEAIVDGVRNGEQGIQQTHLVLLFRV